VSDWRLAVLAEIDELVTECAVKNWNGYGADPINLLSVEKAKAFVRMLPPEFPPAEACADPDGDVSLTWFTPSHTFTVSVGPDGALSYAGLSRRTPA
jgi:hypothetical protein